MTTSPTQLRNLILSILVAFGLSLSAVQPLVALPLIDAQRAARRSVSAPAAIDTTTTLTASPNPSTKDEAVTFTATVTSTSGTPNGGVVTLTEGATVLGTATLVNGVATFSTLTPLVGSHVISATYGGVGSYNGSSSPAFIAVVNDRPSVAKGAGYFCTVRDSGILGCKGYNGQHQTDVPSTTVPFAQVSAVFQHTCAVKEDGALVCWGQNSSNQTEVPSTTVPFVQVSVGQSHTCALKANGALACWGLNDYDQTVVPTATIPFVQVSAGYNHTCALKADGTLGCWGKNLSGQTNVPTTTVPFAQVSAGESHTCALKTDGSLVCWGLNTDGQRDVPTTIVSFVQVSTGYNHTCATKEDGTLVCWGGNSSGQATVPPTYRSFVQVSAGWNATCATKIDKTLACWGSSVPSVVLQPDELERATLGAPYSQTLTASGSYDTVPPYSFSVVSGTVPPDLTLYPTGTLSGVPITETVYEFVAQASDMNGIANTRFYSLTVSHRGDTTTELRATPNPVAYGHNVSLVVTVTTAIDLSPTGVVTFTEGSTVLGTSTLDEAGIGVISVSSLLTGPHTISATYSGNPWVFGSASSVIVVNVNNRPAVNVGDQHACAVKTDGTLGCWGDNSLDQSTPPTATVPFVQVSAGNFFNCALTEAGAAACWGKSSEGQTTVPMLALPFVQIGAGETHACAVEVDGAIACWGDNTAGQTDVLTSTIPYVQVSSGQSHTCALQADGAIICWGRADEGQTTVPSTSAPFVEVSAGNNHTCGRKADQTLACWGANDDGQIDVPDPNSNWQQVSAGVHHTCGVKMDGTLICWGSNIEGQSTVPPTLSPFVQVSAGWASTCAVKADGTIACWGSNSLGQAPVVGLTPTTLPDAPAGLPYAQTISVVLTTGLHSPFTFNVVSGTLPTGLDLDSASGVLEGSPTSIGVFTFTVRAHDINLLGGTQVYSLTVWTLNKIDTTTTLNASANPSSLGKVITFTVWVASELGIPTGVVTLTKGLSTVLGTSALANGVATFTNSSLVIGSHHLTAYYSGDINYNPSDGDLNQEIEPAETEVTLTSSPNPSIYGQPVTLTAVVTSSFDILTGAVSFVEGAASELGTAPLVNGVATIVLSTLTVNLHTIRAIYAGDNFSRPCDSTSLIQEVVDAPITRLRAANSSPIAAGLTTVLSATIDSGTNVVYQWDFGDGVMGSKAVASHIYDQPGFYTALVTATNTLGALSASTLVTVMSGSSIYIPLLLRK